MRKTIKRAIVLLLCVAMVFDGNVASVFAEAREIIADKYGNIDVILEENADEICDDTVESETNVILDDRDNCDSTTECILCEEDYERESKEEVDLQEEQMYGLTVPYMDGTGEPTWDCVYFGNYPQTEVIPSISQWDSIDVKFTNDESPIIDYELYHKLELAKYDRNGYTSVIHNNIEEKYKRVSVNEIRKWYGVFALKFYGWPENVSYRYFRVEPIKWRVLNLSDGKALLLSNRILDNYFYATKDGLPVDYSTVDYAPCDYGCSTIRSWLNGYSSEKNFFGMSYTDSGFYELAFAADEKDAICETVVDNLSDKVFLLDINDMTNEKYGFPKSLYAAEHSNGREAKGTCYATAMGCEVRWLNNLIDPYATTPWWLRSVEFETFAPCILVGTYLKSNVYDVTYGTRPAITLDLSSNNWKPAGVVKAARCGIDCEDDVDIPQKSEYDIKIISHENGKVIPTFGIKEGDTIQQDTTKTNVFICEIKKNEVLGISIVPDEGFVVSNIVVNGGEIDKTQYYDKNGRFFYEVKDIYKDTEVEIWYSSFSNSDLFEKHPEALLGLEQYKMYYALMDEMNALLWDYYDSKNSSIVTKWLLKNLGYNELKLIIETESNSNWTISDTADTLAKELLVNTAESPELIKIIKQGLDNSKGYYGKAKNVKNTVVAVADGLVEKNSLFKELEKLDEYDSVFTEDTFSKIYVEVEKSNIFKKLKSVLKSFGVIIDASDIIVMAYDEFLIDQELVDVLLEYVSESSTLHRGLKRHQDRLESGTGGLKYVVDSIINKYLEKEMEEFFEGVVGNFATFVATDWYNFGFSSYASTGVAMSLVKATASVAAEGSINTPDCSEILKLGMVLGNADCLLSALQRERIDAQNKEYNGIFTVESQMYKDELLYESALCAMDSAYDSLGEISTKLPVELRDRYDDISIKYHTYRNMMEYDKNLAYCRVNYLSNYFDSDEFVELSAKEIEMLNRELIIDEDDENENVEVASYEKEYVVLNRVSLATTNSLFVVRTPEKYDGTTQIKLGDSLYSNNTQVEGIIITDNIIEIGNKCFENCKNLKFVDIGRGVQKIGDGAFAGCDVLQIVDIPVTVSYIGNGAFDAEDIIITGENGSYAEEYALEHGIKFRGRRRHVSSISIFSMPNKIEYGIDENIDLDGLQLQVNYDDGTNAVVDNGYYISGLEQRRFGKNEYKIVYESCDVPIDITFITKPCKYTISFEDEYHNQIKERISGTDYPGKEITVAEDIDGYIPVGEEFSFTIGIENDFVCKYKHKELSVNYYIKTSEQEEFSLVFQDLNSKFGDIIAFYPELLDNQEFTGWYLDSEFINKADDEYIIKDNINLYGEIINKSVSNLSIEILGGEEFTYFGFAIKPEIKIYDGKTLLITNKDYTITFKNNINVGTATVTVKGKGNYSGTETATFEIVERDISQGLFIADPIVINATGKEQKPKAVISFNNKTMPTSGYTYKYYEADDYGNPIGDPLSAVKEPGRYVIQITGIGNFKGTRNQFLVLTADKIPFSKLTVAKVPNQTYTGEAIKPSVTIKHGTKTLKIDEDYIVNYYNNTGVGLAEISIIGRGAYLGTRRVYFNIVGTPITKATVDNLPKTVVYKGTDYTVDDFSGLKLYIKATTKTAEIPLTESNDYEVSYLNNKKLGTATVVFTGINGYTGVLKKTFRITQYKLADDTEGRINVDVKPSVEYSKGGAKPEVVVTFKNADGTTDTLVEKTDYTLSYTNNTAVNDGSNPSKLPTVKVTFKGNYQGTASANYVITAKAISKTDAVAVDKVYANRAGAYKSAVTLTDKDGKKLAANKDYESNVTYKIKGSDTPLDAKSIVDAGTTIVATITAKKGGNYTGSTTCEYRVTQAAINSATIKVEPKIYTGKAIELVPQTDIISAKIGTKVDLVYGTDYEIVPDSYTNNVKKGTASFMIRGLNNYGGTKKITFTIKAKGFSWWWR